MLGVPDQVTGAVPLSPTEGCLSLSAHRLPSKTPTAQEAEVASMLLVTRLGGKGNLNNFPQSRGHNKKCLVKKSWTGRRGRSKSTRQAAGPSQGRGQVGVRGHRAALAEREGRAASQGLGLARLWGARNQGDPKVSHLPHPKGSLPVHPPLQAGWRLVAPRAAPSLCRVPVMSPKGGCSVGASAPARARSPRSALQGQRGAQGEIRTRQVRAGDPAGLCPVGCGRQGTGPRGWAPAGFNGRDLRAQRTSC